MVLISKRVLVTSGGGFLGSHLCERLLQDGHDVLCVDNYFTGRKGVVPTSTSRSGYSTGSRACRWRMV